MHNSNVSVEHNEAANRFQVTHEGMLSLMEYRRQGDQLLFTHTEVPPEQEGQGIAAQMAKVALGYAREQGLCVVPLCAFVATYIRRHREYQDLVA